MTAAASGPEPDGPRPGVPDPMRGLRGVFALTLVLEAIVVALALLVLGQFGVESTPVTIGVVSGLAVAMLLAAGLQRRRWGLGLAVGLQGVMIVSGLLVPVLGVMGLIFGLVWGWLLWLRRDMTGRMARGELPSQQVTDP